MLTYNLTPILAARGIAKPYKFFTSNGFSGSFATKLVKNDLRSITTAHLEKLCTLLNCTPNDLMQWTPSKNDEQNKNHPLRPLIKNETDKDYIHVVQNLPLDKLKEVKNFVLGLKNKQE